MVLLVSVSIRSRVALQQGVAFGQEAAIQAVDRWQLEASDGETNKGLWFQKLGKFCRIQTCEKGNLETPFFSACLPDGFT